MTQLIKNLSAMQETWVRYLGWEDPLEKGTATTPVFWPGELLGLYSPWSCKDSDPTGQLSIQHTDIKYLWSEAKPIPASGMVVLWRTMKNIIDNPQSLSNYSSLLNVQIL